ncbi:MAG: helix-turn-helix domain-containing protein [Treponema sp.]|jgi:hypothetical protein|nr:helix-turn-helix domain-containing protein [Treponema sp.]
MIIKDKSKRKNGKFFQMNNAPVQNGDLTNGAKGLLCYLISLDEKWEVHLRDLIENHRSADKRKTIEKQINELIAAGHIVKKQGANKRRDTTYTVYEIPIHLQGSPE